MASNAGPSTKKQGRWQRRKERQQQKRNDPDSESEEEIPDDAIYGPRGEKKRDFHARVDGQPDASFEAFQRRARARKGKGIEYEFAVFPEEQVLRVDASTTLFSTDKIVRQLSFAPGVNVDDSIISLIADSNPAFRANLQVFVAGNASRAQAIGITDAGVEQLVKACPNLIGVALHNTCNLESNALPAVLKGCANIEAVTISVARTHVSKRTKLNNFLGWLEDKDFVPQLRYLEFRGVYLNPNNRGFLDFLTKRRPALEIIFEYEGDAAFIRDMESIPLIRGPNSATAAAATIIGASSTSTSTANNVEEDDEDAWEDVDDDDAWEDEDLDDAWEKVTRGRSSQYIDAAQEIYRSLLEIDKLIPDGVSLDQIFPDPRANPRTAQQQVLYEALGRDRYFAKMDIDYPDYDSDTYGC